MPIPPRRRWFQFGLSSLFVLVAIVALATRAWQWVIVYVDMEHPIPATSADYSVAEWQELMATRFTKPEKYNFLRQPNPELVWPALAIVAFIAWKSARLIVE